MLFDLGNTYQGHHRIIQYIVMVWFRRHFQQYLSYIVHGGQF
jgi:hypothetical protein